VPRKHRADDDDNMEDDDDQVVGAAKEDDDDDEDTLGLDEAEEEESEDEESDEDDDDEFVKDSVATLESRRLFQHEAEEILENLTLEDVQEVLKDNEIDVKHAARLKRLLGQVVDEGELDKWEDAWEEAIGRLQEEID